MYDTLFIVLYILYILVLTISIKKTITNPSGYYISSWKCF